MNLKNLQPSELQLNAPYIIVPFDYFKADGSINSNPTWAKPSSQYMDVRHARVVDGKPVAGLYVSERERLKAEELDRIDDEIESARMAQADTDDPENQWVDCYDDDEMSVQQLIYGEARHDNRANRRHINRINDETIRADVAASSVI